MKRILSSLAIGLSLTALASSSQGQASHVVISQIFGGGGNTGAPYKSDFVELFNPLSVDVDVSAWSLQYATDIGSTWTKANLNLNSPNVSIPAHSFFLIGLYPLNGSRGASLPTLDATGSFDMNPTAGKVALVKNQTLLSGTNPVGGASIVDFIGYGTTANGFEGSKAPAPSNSTAIFRTKNTSDASNTYNILDTDNNANDFKTATPSPRNSSIQATPGLPAPLVVALGMPFVSHFMRRRRVPAKG